MQNKEKKTYQGKYQVKNPTKYRGNFKNVDFRSSWELQFMKYCDLNPNVARWSSEEVIIPYYHEKEKRKRRYYMDFWVEYTDGRQFLFEIKPAKEAQIPKPHGNKKTKTIMYEQKTFDTNICKWRAAKAYAKKRGMTFKILTEHTLRKHFGLKI